MTLTMIEKPSPNFDSRGDAAITAIILHYTGMESASAALARLCDIEAKVSAHYMVDVDGTIYTHVVEDARAWHAGKSFWRGVRDMNAASIGIEIVNKGHDHGYEDFPDVQIEAVKNLCLAIQSRHAIDDVLAHSDIAPDRKNDPGEKFPWPALAREGVGIWPEVSVEDKVRGNAMDIITALHDFGYDPKAGAQDLIVAFQRHYVPEAFEAGTVGQVCGLTKGRLYALLARYRD